MIKAEQREVYVTSDGKVYVDKITAQRIEMRITMREAFDKAMVEYRKAISSNIQTISLATADSLATLISMNFDEIVDGLNSLDDRE